MKRRILVKAIRYTQIVNIIQKRKTYQQIMKFPFPDDNDCNESLPVELELVSCKTKTNIHKKLFHITWNKLL